ncbi:hypothetical protein [Microbacterium sp. NPDC077184]|uniref:hypothetical protein n=1 Tax=Microbacterium sp. NPDC077184 TaxID=3154764 RepID=UPI003431D1B9
MRLRLCRFVSSSAGLTTFVLVVTGLVYPIGWDVKIGMILIGVPIVVAAVIRATAMSNCGNPVVERAARRVHVAVEASLLRLAKSLVDACRGVCDGAEDRLPWSGRHERKHRRSTR